MMQRKPLAREIVTREYTGHHAPIAPELESVKDWIVYQGGSPVSEPMTYAEALAVGKALPNDGRGVEIIRQSHDPAKPYPRRQAGARTRWTIYRAVDSEPCRRLVAWARREFGAQNWQAHLSQWLAEWRLERWGIESTRGLYDYRAVRRWAATAKGRGERRQAPPVWVMRLVDSNYDTGFRARRTAQALQAVDALIEGV